MIVSFDEIKESGLLLEGDLSSVDLPELPDLAGGGAVFPEPIHYHLQFSRLADIVTLDGILEGSVALPCGRCLEQYRLPIKTRFCISFVRHLPDCVDEDGEEIELSEDELGLIHLDGDDIALLEPVQEQILLALPIRPLCSQDCKGLCPHCGANRNVDACSCAEPIFDSRFAALKDFKVKK